jgi:hypothetical protein
VPLAKFLPQVLAPFEKCLSATCSTHLQIRRYKIVRTSDAPNCYGEREKYRRRPRTFLIARLKIPTDFISRFGTAVAQRQVAVWWEPLPADAPLGKGSITSPSKGALS